ECELDLGRGPLLLSSDPVVIDRWTGLAEHDLLDPVTAGPAVGAGAGDGHAPGGGAAGLDLALEGKQAVPAVGHVVALGLEVGGVVPDQTLEVGPREDLVQLAIVKGLTEVDPALRIVGLESSHVDRAVQRDDLTLLRELGQELGAGRGR